MKICLFHPKLLPPRDYGGVERVVLWLAAGLQECGHEVWVAALAGSQVPLGVKLLAMTAGKTSAWDLLKQLPAGIELVHFMAPPETGIFEDLPCAGLLTVHGNGKPGEEFPLNTVFLSSDHARRHGAQSFIYNGIDPKEYLFSKSAEKTKRALFISKTSWRVKNVSGAVRFSCQAQLGLTIAGGNRPWHTRIAALLTPGMSWVGPVNGVRKAELLRDARALIFPVLWPEPFGLVVVEALMSGTPVIASRKGSMQELVPADVGHLLEAPESKEACQSWVEALGRMKRGEMQWQAERCREWAFEKFHYLKMAEAYESAYKKVAGGDLLNDRPPIASDWKENFA